MRSMLLLSFALLPTAALAQARTISSVAPETTMTAAISGAPAISSALALGEPAHITPHVQIHEIIRTVVEGNPVDSQDSGNSVTFGHPNYETAPRLVKWSNIPVTAADVHGESAVAVSMLVDRLGNPENLYVTSSANPTLDSQVLATVKSFHFEPATEEHVPVEKLVTVTVLFARK